VPITASNPFKWRHYSGDMSRDGITLRTAASPAFTVGTVLTTTGKTTYSIASFDWHGNVSGSNMFIAVEPIQRREHDQKMSTSEGYFPL
jgi:hypothetical protein